MSPAVRSLFTLFIGALFLCSAVDGASARGNKKRKKAAPGTGTPAGLSASKLLDEAVMARGMADFEGSLAKLDKAIKLTKDRAESARIHVLRGANLLDMDRKKDARAAMVSALGQDPGVEASSEMKTAVRNLLSKVRAEASGKLEVTSSKPGTVTVDGKVVGKTPYTAASPIGSHKVAVKAGGISKAKTVMVYPDRTARVKVSFYKAPVKKKGEEKKEGGRLWTWVAGGVGLAAAGAGIGVWFWANSEVPNFEERRDAGADTDELDELESSIRTKEAAAYALWGTAGALGIAAVVLFILEPGFGKEEKAAASVLDSLSVTPVTGQTNGLMLRGSF